MNNTKEIKLQESDFIVSKTDTRGNITYCNREFIRISGYSEKELLGKPHNIVRHSDMPRTVFKLLWDAIKTKEEIFAYVKNRTKDGGYYWVYANVTASIDGDDNIVGYYSVRRKPNEDALGTIETIYKDLLIKEKEKGLDFAYKYLLDILKEKKVSYNEFILNLQHRKGE